MRFSVEPLASEDIDAWVALRTALWPDHPVDEHRRDAHELLARGQRAAVFVAKAAEKLVGFAEVTLRVDYVNGTSSSPVTFLEGLYVAPHFRRHGIARALVDRVERWGAFNGCSEFASDAMLENEDSHAFHEAFGFRETERVVYFLKSIDRDAT